MFLAVSAINMENTSPRPEDAPVITKVLFIARDFRVYKCFNYL